MKASDIIKALVNSINQDFEALNLYEALTAFDRNDIAHPLTKTYFVFKLDSNDISYYQDDVGQVWQKTKLDILVNVYVSFANTTIKAYEDCENVFTYLRNRVSKPMQGYNIGEVTVDKDLRAFKIPCKLCYDFDELIVQNT